MTNEFSIGGSDTGYYDPEVGDTVATKTADYEHAFAKHYRAAGIDVMRGTVQRNSLDSDGDVAVYLIDPPKSRIANKTAFFDSDATWEEDP